MIAPIEPNPMHEPSRVPTDRRLRQRRSERSDASDPAHFQTMTKRSIEATRSVIADNPVAAIAVGIAFGLAAGWAIKRWER